MRRLPSFSVPSVIASLLTLTPASPALAQNAQSILQSVADAQAERWANVNNYTVVKSVEAAGGLETPQYFVKMAVDGQPTFRLVPPPVYEREMLERAGFPPPGPEQYEAMAMGYDLLGSALEQGGGDQPPMPGGREGDSDTTAGRQRGRASRPSAWPARSGASGRPADPRGVAIDPCCTSRMAAIRHRAEGVGPRVKLTATCGRNVPGAIERPVRV